MSALESTGDDTSRRKGDKWILGLIGLVFLVLTLFLVPDMPDPCPPGEQSVNHIAVRVCTP